MGNGSVKSYNQFSGGKGLRNKRKRKLYKKKTDIVEERAESRRVVDNREANWADEWRNIVADKRSNQ